MMRTALYVLYALGVLGLYGAAEWRGWGSSKVSESRTNPRTLRDNPGSYRPHYIYVGGSRRNRGGK
jgi:hypothetical protein